MVRADRRDAAVADRHVAVDDVEAVVHREDEAAADEEGHDSRGLQSRVDLQSSTFRLQP